MARRRRTHGARARRRYASGRYTWWVHPAGAGSFLWMKLPAKTSW